MTDKEKAKAYDEAFKKACAAYKDEDRHLKATLERIFPELKEPEDERIKKAIIEFFESEDDNTTYSLDRKKDIIAWLEKQGKQKKQVHFPKFTFDDVLALQCCMETVKKLQEDKELYEQLNLIHNKIHDAYWLDKQGENSTDKTKQRFNIGDWVVDITDKSIYQVEKKENCKYILRHHILGDLILYLPFSLGGLIRKWTIQDVKDGDVIHMGEVTAIFKKYIGGEKCICYCSFCKDGGFENPMEDEEDNVYGCYNATPATKEQRDTFMKVMNNAGYEWDVEKKELKKKD